MRLQKVSKAWFDYPNDEDDAKFEIKHLLSGDVSSIVSKTHKRRFEFKEDSEGKLQPMPVLETDDLLDRQLTMAAAITDWENINDEEGKSLECNSDNILRLCNEQEEKDFEKFQTFITECRNKLADLATDQAKEEKKI